MIPPITGSNSHVPPFFHSRGRYTEGTASADLQELIDDLAGRGGTVFVCQPETILLNPLILPSGVTVDFQGNTARLGHQTLAEVVKSSLVVFANTQNAHLVNVRVGPLFLENLSEDPEFAPICTEHQTDPICIVDSRSGPVLDSGIRRLVLDSGEQALPGYTNEKVSPQHCFNGIEMTSGSGNSIASNHFRDFFSRGICNGLVLIEGEGAEIEGNLFSNWALYRCMSLVSFRPTTPPSPRGFIHNTFEIFRSQSDLTFSKAGFRHISGTGNHVDHVLIWDWWYVHGCCDNSIADFHVGSGAQFTYLNADAIGGLFNESSSTRVIAPAIPCASTVSMDIDCTCAVEPACSIHLEDCTAGAYYVTPVAWIDKPTLCFCPTEGDSTCTTADGITNAGEMSARDLPSSPDFSLLPQPPAAPETRIDRHPPKVLTWRDLGHPEPSLAGGIHTSPNKVLTWRDFSPGVWFW